MGQTSVSSLNTVVPWCPHVSGQVPSSNAQYLLENIQSFSGMLLAHICAGYEHSMSLEQVNVKMGACRTGSSLLSCLVWLVDVSVDIVSALLCHWQDVSTDKSQTVYSQARNICIRNKSNIGVASRA